LRDTVTPNKKPKKKDEKKMTEENRTGQMTAAQGRVAGMRKGHGVEASVLPVFRELVRLDLELLATVQLEEQPFASRRLVILIRTHASDQNNQRLQLLEARCVIKSPKV